MTVLETLETETGPDPRTSIIVLHGLGADGNDFVSIAEELSLEEVGPVRFVFPHAPVIPVTINNGYRMRAWYDILGFDLVSREDEAGLRLSLAAVQGLIDKEVARGTPSERIVLAGFSQGCAMALLAGIRYPQPLAGIAGLSGYLPLAAASAAERTQANAQTPVFLAHGRLDNVVAVDRGRAARDALQALGHPVQWHEYPMAHSVCLEEIADLNQWLLRVLARSDAGLTSS